MTRTFWSALNSIRIVSTRRGISSCALSWSVLATANCAVHRPKRTGPSHATSANRNATGLTSRVRSLVAQIPKSSFRNWPAPGLPSTRLSCSDAQKHCKETDKEANVREDTLFTVDEVAEILEARVDFLSG